MRLVQPVKALRALAFRIYRGVATAFPGGRMGAFGAGASRIGAILVVNLDRQPLRMARTLRELARFRDYDGRRLTDRVTRLPAIDARDGRAVAATADVDPRYVLDHQLYVQPDDRLGACFGRDEAVMMTRQEIAVARSHIEAWKAVATGSTEYVLILEDDVWFRLGAAELIDRAWREATTGPHSQGPTMLYLSYEDAGGTCERADVCEALFRPVRGLWFLCGYVLSRKGAQSLLHAMPVVGPVDMWINRQFDLLRPLAVMRPVLLQRLDAGSDNSYSVLPYLARAGIVDSDAPPAPDQSSCNVRLIAWTSRGAREPLAMALSMLGLRVLAFDPTATGMAEVEIAALFKTFDVLVDPPFAPNATPDGVAELVTGLILESTKAEQMEASELRRHPLFILPGTEAGDHWWPPLCSATGTAIPIQSFPSGAPSEWRLFRDGRRASGHSPGTVHVSRPLVMDATPWVVEAVNGWPAPSGNPSSAYARRTAKLRCSLTEPHIEMSAALGTFPGNLAIFDANAIDYGPDGATITLSESGAEDRPFRSGALTSARRFLHGRFEVEMRAARGGGVVTGFFLHRSGPRQEIDIEITGDQPNRILLNVFFNPGDECTDLDYGYRGSPCVVDLGFDASAAFHRYAIEWFPDRICWFVDNILIHDRGSWDPTPVPHLSMTLHANLWSPRSVELAGKIRTRPILATASFRDVKVDA